MHVKSPEIVRELAESGILPPKPKRQRTASVRKSNPVLTDRHRLIAALRASGMTQHEIGAKLKMAPASVMTTLRLPQVRLFHSELRHDVTEKITSELASAINADAMENFNVIRSIRDRADDYRTRLRAAEILFDRQQPVKHQVDARKVSISINGESADKLIAGLRETFDAGTLRSIAETNETA